MLADPSVFRDEDEFAFGRVVALFFFLIAASLVVEVEEPETFLGPSGWPCCNMWWASSCGPWPAPVINALSVLDAMDDLGMSEGEEVLKSIYDARYSWWKRHKADVQLSDTNMSVGHLLLIPRKSE